MNSKALYDFISIARAENKSLVLDVSCSEEINQIILNPKVDIIFPDEHTLQTKNSLINLNYIISVRLQKLEGEL